MKELQGVVIEVDYFREHACSVYRLSKNGKEVMVTLTDTERANNKYHTKMAKAVEELNAKCPDSARVRS